MQLRSYGSCENSGFNSIARAQQSATIRLRVHILRNIYTLLHTILGCLVALSSASGVSRKTSWANYAERCTFQDAFGQLRRAHYQKSTSPNLGLKRTDGLFAENEALRIESQICSGLTAKEESIMGIVPLTKLINGDEATSLEHVHVSLPIYFNMTCTDADAIATEQDLKSAVPFCR